MNIEYVLGDIGEVVFCQGFYYFQVVVVFVDDFLSKFDVFDDIVFRYIF